MHLVARKNDVEHYILSSPHCVFFFLSLLVVAYYFFLENMYDVVVPPRSISSYSVCPLIHVGAAGFYLAYSATTTTRDS